MSLGYAPAEKHLQNLIWSAGHSGDLLLVCTLWHFWQDNLRTRLSIGTHQLSKTLQLTTCKAGSLGIMPHWSIQEQVHPQAPWPGKSLTGSDVTFFHLWLPTPSKLVCLSVHGCSSLGAIHHGMWISMKSAENSRVSTKTKTKSFFSCSQRTDPAQKFTNYMPLAIKAMKQTLVWSSKYWPARTFNRNNSEQHQQHQSDKAGPSQVNCPAC